MRFGRFFTVSVMVRPSDSRWHGPAAADTQVWMMTGSSGSAVVRSPVRRSRTPPSVRGTTQPKQMPIRQPDGISTPASSPASSRVVDASASMVMPEQVKVTSPPSPTAWIARAEPLGVQAVGQAGVGPVCLGVVEQAGRAAGPGLPGAPIGDDGVELGHGQHARRPGEAGDQPDPTRVGERPEFRAEQHLLGGGRGVHHHHVPRQRRVAQHPHDGGDAAAGGEEQHGVRHLAGQDEVARGLVEQDDGPGPEARRRGC